jgi:hypothetical protein
MLRRALAVFSLLFFLGTGAFVADSPVPPNSSQLITLKRPLDLPKLPHRIGDGSLTLIGGWELDSENSDFGGYSALHAMGQGRFLALSDASVLAGFTLTDGEAARDSFIAPLPVRKGERSTKKEQDSESLTHDPVSGRFWVGFEQRHRIRRYAPAFARAEATGTPRIMGDWPTNGGAEAMVRRRDGSFVLFAESHAQRPSLTTGLVFASDPSEPGAKARRFAYRPPAGYWITDVASLGDGRLIALHRSFSFIEGFKAKIGIIDRDAIVPGAIVKPRIIADLAPSFPVDNMEGIAVERVGDRTIIWMISDDNFMPIQRTLLLKFAFREAAASPRP